MFKRKDKRGWIRIVEVFVAVIIISTVVLLVIKNDQDNREDVSSRTSDSITAMVGEIQLDNDLRSEIVSTSDADLPVEWEDFDTKAPETKTRIIEKTPSYLKCVSKICSTSDSCLLSQNPDKTIYAESVIISSDLETYNQRTLKIFCWEPGKDEGDSTASSGGSGGTGGGGSGGSGGGGGGSGGSGRTGGSGTAVCPNNIIESGETCDDGNIVSGDGCSSSCQTETATYLTSCGEITSPGYYVLSNNLTGTAPNACLNIHDVSNVYLDCQNKSVKVPGLITGQTIVKVNNTNGFSLKNCLLSLTSIPTGHIPQSLSVSSSSQGVISGNNFSGKGLVNVGYSSNLDILNNIFNEAAYQQGLTNNTRIENNSFDWNYSGAGLIVSNTAFGTLIKNNVLNGKGTGTPSNAHQGFDDGIVIDNESNDIISGNTMSNFWDCGIETLGLIQNSAITNNTIKNASFCGIGGWYWNSLKNNTFSQNKIDNSGTLFTFNRRYSLKTGEDFVYFTNNIFTDNILTNVNNVRGYATDIDMNRSNWGEVPDDKFVHSNATFINNDFGTGPGPYISPRNIIIDGGGNKCGAVSLGQGTSPVACN